MIKVLVADDHPILRKGLRLICEHFVDIRVAGEAGNEKEMLAKLSSGSYDVIVLDTSLPDKSGTDILGGLKSLYPGLPVLMLGMNAEEQYALSALRNGASGYLTKKAAPDELAAAVRKVAKGERYISPQLAEELASSLVEKSDFCLDGKLSHREYQVLCLLAEGKLIKEIAGELSISEKTVSTYRIRALKKMRFKSNVEITRYFIGKGLLPSTEASKSCSSRQRRKSSAGYSPVGVSLTRKSAFPLRGFTL